jgi:hypothetical protein
MERKSPIITNFSQGEVDEAFWGRVEMSQYFNSCRIAQNGIVLTLGGFAKRPGTYFVSNSKNNGKVRLVPFKFSITQEYILEFGNNYIRFYMNDGQIQEAYAAWVTTTAYIPGNLVTQGGLYYRCLVAHTSGTFATDLAAGDWALTAGATDLACEIPTNYTLAELFQLKFAQSADTLYIAHPNHFPRQLTRTSHTAWTLADCSFTATPTGSVFFSSTTITNCANNGAGLIRVTAASHGLATGLTAGICGVNGCTEANGKWTVTYVDVNTVDLQGSAFVNAYTSGGQISQNVPACVAFFEQRLCWANTYAKPQTVYMSRNGDYLNHGITSPTQDNDALSYTILSDNVNAIRWMLPKDWLFMGTVDAEWKTGGSTATDPITPTSIQAKRQSNNGAADIQGILINNTVVYVQYHGRKVFEIEYNLYNDNYDSVPMTKLSRNITYGGIVDMSYQKEPDPIVWFIRADGTLLSMTYYLAEKVIAWSRQITGTNQDTTDGKFESISVVNNNATSEDEIWVSVARTFNGVTQRCIEYFMPREIETKTDSFFVDCGLSFNGGAAVNITGASQTNPVVISYSGADPTNGWTVYIENVQGMTDINGQNFIVANVNAGAKTFQLSGINGVGFGAYTLGGDFKRVVKTVTGLTQLIGQTVDVCADGAAHPQCIVAGDGSITLNAYYNKIAAGLNFSYQLQPMKFEVQVGTGSASSLGKRIEKGTVRFFNTIGGQIGPDTSNLEDIIFGTNIALFTGDMEVEFKGDYESGADFLIVHNQPLPITVVAIMPAITVYER